MGTNLLPPKTICAYTSSAMIGIPKSLAVSAICTIFSDMQFCNQQDANFAVLKHGHEEVEAEFSGIRRIVSLFSYIHRNIYGLFMNYH
jgi:hypothetical protein